MKYRCARPQTAVVFLLLLALFGGAMLFHPWVSRAQDSLTVRGKVVNGTSGFQAPDGLAVLMLITGPDGTLAGTGQAALEPDGSFIFEKVDMVEQGVYTLSVDYGGVFYGQTLTAGELDGEQVITVYEPTEDAGIIVVDRHVMVVTGFDMSERVATATEFVRFTNPTDRTLQANLETARPGMFSFMRFALPPNAANVTVQSDLRGGEVISVGTGFALTAPVTPGEHSVDFAYTFTYEGDSVEYRNSLPQGAGIFQILVPDDWEGIEVAGLEPREPVGIQADVYKAWEEREIPAGPGLGIRLSGLPQPGMLARAGSALTAGSFWTVAIPCALGAALLALLVLGTARRYRPATPTGIEVGAATHEFSDGDSSTRTQIVAQLAALDELHSRDGIPETDYLEQRAALVARALGEPPENGS